MGAVPIPCRVFKGYYAYKDTMDIIKNENATRIVASLREGPKTIAQLGSVTGITDRATRTAVDSLASANYILKAGFHNRSVLWRVNSAVAGGEEISGNLPYHDIKVTGGSANIVDIALSAMVKCQPVPSAATITKADYYTRTVFPLLAKYLGLITAFEPDMESIFEVRNELLQAYKTINSTSYMLKQILEHKDYWDVARIKLLRDAPLILNSAEEIHSAYLIAERYLEGESIAQIIAPEVVGE